MKIKNLSLLLSALIFMLSALIFTSCSMATLLVGKADYFITKELAKALALNSDQKSELRPDVEDWLNQIKPEIKLMRDRLNAHKRLVEKGNPSKEFAALQAREMSSLTFKLVKALAPALAKQMVGLNEKQKSHFFKDWKKENDKLREWIDKDKPGYPYANFRGVFGELSAAQEDFFKAQKARFLKRNKERLKNRLAFQEELKILLDQKQGPQKVSGAIESFLKKKFNGKNTSIYGELAWNILQTADKEQMENFHDKSSLIVEFLEALAQAEF